MKIITGVEPRTYEKNRRLILLPLYFFEKQLGDIFNHQNLETYLWMYSYCVLTEHKEHAEKTRNELHMILENGASILSPQVTEKLDELKRLRLLSYEEMNAAEKWDYVANQMPEDIGGSYKKSLIRIISEKVSGEILEAMCGFNSYIIPHIDRIITAQDYSEKMLLRYEYPKRKRILFDLDSLPLKEFKLPDETFDCIMFVKGYKYIRFPIDMFREFHRLLKPSGNLIFAESTTAGYEDIILRQLNVSVCKKELHQAGFREKSIQCFDFDPYHFEELILFNYIK